MPTHINIIQIDDSSDKTIVGTITYDRTNGGILITPSGSSFPGSPSAGEIFWRSDQDILYRRNDTNTIWESVNTAATSGPAGGDLDGYYPNPDVVDLTIIGEVQGSILYFDGSNWVQLPPSTSGLSLLTQGVGSDPIWGAPAPGGAAGGDLSGTYPNPTVVDLTITSEVQGSILYFNGSNWVQLSPGTAGQVLETQGTGADPIWADGIEVQEDDVNVITNLTILNFGNNLNVTDDTGGKVTVDSDLSGVVPNTRQVIAGDGLTGGGDLSADRTFDVVANADGSIVVNANDIQVGVLASDAQHGNLGGGSLHAAATTSVAGFLSASDKTKLDGIEAGAQVNTVDSVFGRTGAVVAATSDYDANQVDFTPDGDIAATDVQAAIVEVRDDTDTKLTGKADVTHAPTHLPSGSDPLTTAAASTLTPDLSNAEGTAESFARSDHIHNVPADTAVDIEAGGTSSEGVAASFARSDHVHRIIDPSDEVSASGNISTTSSSPITATSMTITPGAGTYMVWFSAYGLHNNNNAELAIGIAVSGTDVSDSERRWGGTNQSDGMFATLATQARVSITGGQTIQGRFWKATGGGSVELEDRTLSIIKVDD